MDKNEIKALFSTFKINKKIISSSSEINMLVNKLENAINYERPDAYIQIDNFVYGIEHFQISQYYKDKSGDIAQKTKGILNNKKTTTKEDDIFFNPSIDNLCKALSSNLQQHSKNFECYKSRIIEKTGMDASLYRLVIFVEDSTESGYIVKKRDTQTVFPMDLDKLAECLLNYKDSVWGILYSYGNEREKILSGYTMEELATKKENGILLDSSKYTPFEFQKKQHISAGENREDDTTTVSIKLFETIRR